MMISRVSEIPPSGTIGMADKIRRMIHRGDQVINLAGFNPDFETADHIKDSAKNALEGGYAGLTDSRGLLELREALAAKLEKENRISADPETEILITVGAKEAVFAAILSLISPGDEVLVFDPSWVTYVPCVYIAGGKPVPIPLREEEDFSLDENEIKRVITPRTKMIILNSPHNPTGKVFSLKEIESIARVVNDNELLVISDESYDKIIYDGYKHYSIASLPRMAQHTITINSFSKTYVMAGWRVGYAIANREIIDSMLMIHQHAVSCPSSFAQKAAVTAVNGSQETVKEMIRKFKERRDYIVEEIRGIDRISFMRPRGTFHIFPNVSKYGKSSQELAELLLEETKVATVPGISFGNNGEGHLRISFTNSSEYIRKGVDRIKSFLKKA